MVRILAQLAAAATTDEQLYRVTTGARMTGTVYIANRGANTTFRLAFVRSGETLGNKSYTHYDVAISANTTTAVENVTLGPDDQIRSYAGANTLTFTVFGDEQPIPNE